MRGLIKKDLYLIKNNFRSLIILFLIFILMSFQKYMDIAFILPMMCIMLFISTFSYDDFNNFNAYAITFPNGRKNVVKAKYFSTIILMLITTLLSFVLSFIFSYIKNSFNLEQILGSLAGGLIAVIIIVTIMYPLIFKFGSEKGRIGMFAFVFILTFLIGSISSVFDLTTINSFLDSITKYMVFIIPIILLLMLFISYQVSKLIFLKKEF